MSIDQNGGRLNRSGPGSSRVSAARSGHALLWVIVAVLALLALWGWLATRQRTASSPAEGAARPGAETASSTAPTQSADNAFGSAGIDLTSSAARRSGGASEPGRAPSRPPELDFDGRGRLRGHIRPPSGLDAPTEWTLVLAPAPSLVGGDRAEARRVEFRDGEAEFDLADVPLGGYAVRAEAFGLQCNAQFVTLSKPGRDQQFVQMAWRATGFLEGRVVDARGMPAANLEVHCVAKHAADAEVASTRTSAGGDWLIDNLRDGEYSLVLGLWEHPLGEPREFAFRAPTQRLETIELPDIYGDLKVRVRDSGNAPVAGAEIEGYSAEGGRIRGRTDADGVLHARFLVAGRYTVVARSELFGEVRGREEVTKTRSSELELRYP